jgi:similar to stage IV sporulation protein
MRLVYFLWGYVLLTVRGAAPEAAVNRFAAARLRFWDLRRVDDLTVTVKVLYRDRDRALALCRRVLCDGQVTAVYGFRQVFGGLKRRPVLLSGLALALAAALVLPQFVWTITVTGNETLHDEEILRALEELGVGFGTFGPSIQPQKLKYKMLELFPQLEWLTVNCTGGRAEVVVRERLLSPEVTDRYAVSNIVASCDGVLVSMDVLQGKAVATVGQTVLAGELLVSGVQDQTNHVQLWNAEAEVYARTWHQITAVTPVNIDQKSSDGEEKVTKYLILGRKRIKLSGNSGISLTTYDKIIADYPLTLPGGLTLPVTLEVVTATAYTTETVAADRDGAAAVLEQCAQATVQADLTAGEILSVRQTMDVSAGCYVLEAAFDCREEISQTVPVEWNGSEVYGKDDQRGTDGADH